jgi:hypothetical protein
MLREHLLSVTAATREVPGRPHVSTLWRWINRGIRGIRLETVMVGGRRFTSREALDRFFASITAATAGEPLPVRTTRQRTRDIDQARRELTEAGI